MDEMHRAKPFVSIVLPTFNRAHLINKSIDSVISQTYSNFELLVIDDGSTDGTRTILEKETDPRVKKYFLSHKGRSFARNYGISLSKGELITFLDSDDLYLPDKIQTQIDFFENNPDAMMVYTSAECFEDDEVKKITHIYKAEKSGNIYEDIAAYVPLTICLPTVMLKREAITKIGLFDETLERFEDTDYWRRVSLEYPIHAISESTCLIRTHKGNTLDSLDIKQLANQVRKYGNKVIKEDTKSLSNRVPELVADFYRHYGIAILKNSRKTSWGVHLLLRGKRLKFLRNPANDYTLLEKFLSRHSVIFGLKRKYLARKGSDFDGF